MHTYIETNVSKCEVIKKKEWQVEGKQSGQYGFKATVLKKIECRIKN